MQVRVNCSCGEGNCREWAIVELQGVVEAQPHLQDHLQDLQIGLLCRPSSQESYTFTVGYHELTGTKVALKKPMLVLKKIKHSTGEEDGDDDNNNSSSRVELDVIGIIRHRILFKTRPKALISNPVISTDQKGDAFWSCICTYYKESNSNLIKRGATMMKKRWHRINDVAQRFGGCFDQATPNIGSGSNMENTMELAHQLFISKDKKCKFERHWHEFRREQKWKTPLTNCGSTKRTKINVFGDYSSSSNNETSSSKDYAVNFPIRLKGIKAVKRKGKRKSKVPSRSPILVEDIELANSYVTRKLNLMEEFNAIKKRELEVKEIKIQKEWEVKVLTINTSSFNQMQLEVHAKMLESIKAKYNI